MPVAHDRELQFEVVHRGGLGGARGREAQHQRSLANGGGEGVRIRAGGFERARRQLRRGHATPTCTSRKRAGAAPCETRMTCPGSPLPQSMKETSSHSDGEQTASQPAQNAGVVPA